jgi:hypothetical protein
MGKEEAKEVEEMRANALGLIEKLWAKREVEALLDIASEATNFAVDGYRRKKG